MARRRVSSRTKLNLSKIAVSGILGAAIGAVKGGTAGAVIGGALGAAGGASGWKTKKRERKDVARGVAESKREQKYYAEQDKVKGGSKEGHWITVRGRRIFVQDKKGAAPTKAKAK